MAVAKLKVVQPSSTYVDIPDDYRDEFLLCRGIHHAWGRPRYYPATIGGMRRWLLCARCGTERTDERFAGTVRRRYDYPEGYRLPGRVHATDVWDATVARGEVFDSEETMRASVTGRRRKVLI